MKLPDNIMSSKQQNDSMVGLDPVSVSGGMADSWQVV